MRNCPDLTTALAVTVAAVSVAGPVLRCPPVFAQTAPQDASQKIPTRQLEAESVYVMRRGIRLETAISHLTEAVRREPKNPRLAILLACAQAERAHVLSGAVTELRSPSARRAAQESLLARWAAAQQDDKSPLYGKPKPEFPPVQDDVPRTRDDNKPLTLSEESAGRRVCALSESALSLLESATRLSESEKITPEMRADNAFLSGWTALVLWQLPRRVVPESWPVKNGKPEGPDRIVAFLERAIALQPENSSYRLGLADACQIMAVDKDSPFLPPVRFDKPLYERSKALLLEVAKRRPRDGELWFRIACMEGQGTGIMDGYSRRTPENLAALRHASEAFPSNALVWYTLAAAQVTTRDIGGMQASMARGNAALDLLPIRYKYAAPVVAQWVFGEASNQYPGTTNLLAMGLMSLEQTAKQMGDDSLRAKTVEIARQIRLKYEDAAKNPNLIGSEQVLLSTVAGMMQSFQTRVSAPPTNP